MSFWEDRLAIDLRALALYRIALGLLVLISLGQWLPDFPFLLSEGGALTLSSLVGDTPFGVDAFSLYNACTYRVFPYLLFGLTVLVALAVSAGWKCKVTGPALFLLVLSLQNRAAVLLDQTDRLLLVGLFFGMMLPWDRRYLWAADSRTAEDEPSRTITPAGVGYMGYFLFSLLLAALHPGLSPQGRVALLVAVLALPLSAGRARTLVLASLAAVALALAPQSGWLLPLRLVALLPWLYAGGPVRRQVPLGQTVATGLGLLVLAATALADQLAPEDTPMALRQTAAFFALGPRGTLVDDSRWYVAVARDKDGRRWLLPGPQAKVDFARPDVPLEQGSYRRRLYWGALQQPHYWGLKFWLPMRYLQWYRQGDPVEVEIHECRQGPRQVEHFVFSRWPMTDQG